MVSCNYLCILDCDIAKRMIPAVGVGVVMQGSSFFVFEYPYLTFKQCLTEFALLYTVHLSALAIVSVRRPGLSQVLKSALG